MLNKNIFQILITENDQLSYIPDSISISSDSFKNLHPDYKYHRLNGNDLEAFISSNFDSDTLNCFKTLKPFSYKSNIGRYCLLLAMGGIYADVVIRLLRPLNLPEGKTMICFRDAPGSGLWAVSTSLIAAKAGLDELKLAIELVKQNVSSCHYGASPIHVSGPAVFGRALAIINKLEFIDFGHFEYLGRDYNPHNLGHINSSGQIVSLRCKSGDFTELGIPGTNSYSEMWRSKTVYGEKSKIYMASELTIYPVEGNITRLVQRNIAGISFVKEAQGWICYGPYIDLEPGQYLAIYKFSSDTNLNGLTIDVIRMKDSKILDLAKVVIQQSVDTDFCIAFALDEKSSGIQVRVYSNGSAHGTILSLEIQFENHSIEPEDSKVI